MHLGDLQVDAGDPLRLGFDDEWFVGGDSHNYYAWSYVTGSGDPVVEEENGFYRTIVKTDRAIDYIKRQDGDSPWCLFMSWGPPHPPLLAPDPYVTALEKSGQAENTIVIYSSDHGEMLASQGLRGKRWPHRESTQAACKRCTIACIIVGKSKPKVCADLKIFSNEISKRR